MQKNTIENRKYEHRGVAPIIATLLMVAISVIGGILIFVFAQGFFQDSSVQAPTLESIEIFGYDLRPVAAPSNAAGIALGTCGAAGGGLDDDDCFTIFIRNKSANAVVIQDVVIFGVKYLFATATDETTLNEPAFCIVIGSATDCNGTGIVASGQDAAIVVEFEHAVSGIIKQGRPLQVNIVTGNGNVFSKQLTVGNTAGL